MRITSSAFVVVVMLLSSGCSSSTEVLCTAVGISAVATRVRDAATGAYIAGGASLVTLKDGESRTTTWADNRSFDELEIPSKFYDPGLYDVTVRKPGYQDWVRSAIRVENSGVCDRPITVRLEANLTRTQ